MKTFPASLALGIIQIASASLGRNVSAALCLAEARALADEGKRFDYAAGRALQSIAYSRGVASEQYRFAALIFEEGRS